jgi:hypothetical protein
MAIRGLLLAVSAADADYELLPCFTPNHSLTHYQHLQKAVA